MDLYFSDSTITEKTNICTCGNESKTLKMTDMKMSNGCTIWGYKNNLFNIKCPKDYVKNETDTKLSFRKTADSVERHIENIKNGKSSHFIEMSDMEPVLLDGYTKCEAYAPGPFEPFSITFFKN